MSKDLSNKRLLWIDILRGLTIMLVVMWHVNLVDLSTGLNRLSSYLVWVGVKFSNAEEEELLINDASQIGSKKFDFSIE